MANDKKFVVKNGLTTQNISFVDDTNVANNTITVTMLNSDTLSFSGQSGQLFSITDSLTGTIFAVNDISGIPSIEVDDTGTIRLAEISGNVGIGTPSPTAKLHVVGDVLMTANLAVDTNTLKVDSVNKRVGVRSTNPTSVFEVFSSANTAQWVVRAKTDSIFNSSGIWVDAFNNFTFDARDAAGNLNVSLNSSGVSFLKGGNVGIGNSNPTENLHVQGNIRVANAYVDATNSKGTAGQVLTSNSTHSYWAAVGAASNLVLTGSVTEDIFAITDGASVNLDPTNGSIQTWTLGATRTPGQANWSAGQGIILMVDDGSAYSITWTTLGVVWKSDGGVAPTLNTTGYTVIALWKVGTTIYGARVGNA